VTTSTVYLLTTRSIFEAYTERNGYP